MTTTTASSGKLVANVFPANREALRGSVWQNVGAWCEILTDTGKVVFTAAPFDTLENATAHGRKMVARWSR